VPLNGFVPNIVYGYDDCGARVGYYMPEIFVLKLSSSGAYQWHTFYGSGITDRAYGIAADSSNVYVTGQSEATWGTPLHAFDASAYNFFVLKLSSAGAHQWHTFYGKGEGRSIAVDSGGNSFIAGTSNATWTGPTVQSPKNNYATGANSQVTVLKLNGSGAYQWHTFYGPSSVSNATTGNGIALDTQDNVYVTGEVYSSFNGPSGQSPLNPCGTDSGSILVMKLDADGSYKWHTCYYGSGSWGSSIAVDGSGSSFVTGETPFMFGYPHDNDAIYDMTWTFGTAAFVLKLDNAGAHQWHAYFGGETDGYSPGDIAGVGIALDSSGNINVAGATNPPWNGPSGEAPRHPYRLKYDGLGNLYGYAHDLFVLKMASSAGCWYVGGPDNTYAFYDIPGGTGSFEVVAQRDTSSAICSWNAVSNSAWLQVTSGSSGTGNGTVGFSVEANTNSYDRIGSITIGGQYSYSVYQAGTGTSGASAPTVTTNPTITGITETAATSGGNVADDGGATVMERGVCWSTSTNPSKSDTCSSDGSGTGEFVSALSGLDPGQTYHVRAFASNMKYVGYGADVHFTTSAPSQYALVANAAGSGYGAVSSDAGLISYSYPANNGASALLNTGTAVTLTASSAAGSTVAWTGNCSSTGGSSTIATCSIVNMNAEKIVTATFSSPCTNGPVTIDSSYFNAIQAGYNYATGADMLQIQALNFRENLNFNHAGPIVLKGGYDCGFTANSGFATVHGSMTIGGAPVTLENIIIADY
ncbi:MAG TPA: SBBP repeat-containing protein, partial [Dissulfurispiraceae bacterium]|nr:SBBP repeat-containing protein [Dissulfurispiraceae bacterium]